MKRAQPVAFDSTEYDYMDKMPVEGWFWEIIRRSTDYRQAFDKFQKTILDKVSALSKNSKAVDERWLSIRVREVTKNHIKKVQEMGVHIDWFVTRRKKEPNTNHLLVIRVGVEHLMIPRPEISYSDFDDDYKPGILGLDPFVISIWDDLKDLTKPINLTPGAPSEHDEWEIASAKDCLETLSPTIPEETIYIGISRKAKLEDIEKRLLPELREHLDRKKPRMRDDKWKYYLITYDHRTALGYKYGQISDELYEAYKMEELADERTIIRYYKEALALISGGYKDYLYL